MFGCTALTEGARLRSTSDMHPFLKYSLTCHDFRWSSELPKYIPWYFIDVFDMWPERAETSRCRRGGRRCRHRWHTWRLNRYRARRVLELVTGVWVVQRGQTRAASTWWRHDRRRRRRRRVSHLLLLLANDWRRQGVLTHLKSCGVVTLLPHKIHFHLMTCHH